MEKQTREEEFNFDIHLISLMMKEPFYGSISRRTHKVKSDSIKTAAVYWDKYADSLVLMWNPTFMASLTPKQIKNVLKHEFSHIIFGHITSRIKKPHSVWNWATDLAINSLIFTSEKCDVNERDEAKLPLPGFCLVPGRDYTYMYTEGKCSKDEEKAHKTLGDIIKSLPGGLSSEDYFQRIMKEVPEDEQCDMCNGTGRVPDDKEGESGSDKNDKESQGNQEGNDSDSHSHDGSKPCPKCSGTGKCGPGMLDEHNWDNMTDKEREYAQDRIRNIMEKAVREADSSNSWGSIPADLQAEIRRSISRIVPWRTVLKQFIGTMLPGEHTTSIKRINRKFPYIHPGIKRGRRPKLLICIDQSGSVDDGMLTLFFGELTNLAKNCDIWVLPFDCAADPKEIYLWRKGAPCPKGRQHCGGTNFDVPNDIVNSKAMRGKFDGVLVVTDGEAPQPKASRVRRGWVLAPNHKLMFETGELQVFIDHAKPIVKGAWR